MLLAKFKISGHSMEPALKNGQTVLVSSLPLILLKPKVGDIVAFKYDGKILIKRINKIEGKNHFVSGDNKKDSLGIKPIERKNILGKVIMLRRML